MWTITRSLRETAWLAMRGFLMPLLPSLPILGTLAAVACTFYGVGVFSRFCVDPLSLRTTGKGLQAAVLQARVVLQDRTPFRIGTPQQGLISPATGHHEDHELRTLRGGEVKPQSSEQAGPENSLAANTAQSSANSGSSIDSNESTPHPPESTAPSAPSQFGLTAPELGEEGTSSWRLVSGLVPNGGSTMLT